MTLSDVGIFCAAGAVVLFGTGVMIVVLRRRLVAGAADRIARLREGT